MNDINHVVVIGQGYVGLPLSVRAAKSGFIVHGFDVDGAKVKELISGITKSPDVSKEDLINLQKEKKLTFTVKMPSVPENSIYVIAVPTPLDSHNKPDLTFLSSACDLISSSVKENSLIINESTSYIGTLRTMIKPIIDSKSGLKKLKYAVAPERIDPGNKLWGMENTPRVVSGITTESQTLAIDFYSKFCSNLYLVSKPEVAEAAKLFENTFRQVNIALVNEFSLLTNEIGISSYEVINAAATKPFGFMPFYPGIGVGGHCIPVDPSYLSYSAEIAGVKADFISLANKLNLSMAKTIAKRINAQFGGEIIGKRIQIAGIAYKPNIADTRESPALDLIKELNSLGFIVSWHDPVVKSLNGEKSVPLDPSIDLGLIVTPHSIIDFEIWKKNNTNVLDLSSSSENYGWSKFF